MTFRLPYIKPAVRLKSAPDPTPQTNINIFKNPIPFSQTDWPRTQPVKLSVSRVYHTDPSTYTNPIPFNGNTVQPRQFNTPSIIWVAPSNIALTTVVVQNPFYTQDFSTTHVGPDYLPTPQYPNLVLQQFSTPFYTQDFATSHVVPDWASPPQYPNIVLLQPIAAPFYTQDFSKPFVPAPAKPDQQPLNTNLFTNPIPFGPYSWLKPNQPLPTKFVDYPNIALLNPVVVTNPFIAYDFSKASAYLPSNPQHPPFNSCLFDFVLLPLNAQEFTGWVPLSAPPQQQPYNPNLYTPGTAPSPLIPFDYSYSIRLPSVPQPSSGMALNINLLTNPTPLNQIDWSKPYRIVPIASDQNSLPNLILYQPVPSNPSNPLGIYSWADLYKYVTLHPNTPALLPNLTLVLPPPPPDTGPIGGWRWIDGVMRMREKQLDRRDQNASAVMLGKLGGLARAQALTTKQRSNIASKAAQVRWNPPAKKR